MKFEAKNSDLRLILRGLIELDQLIYEESEKIQLNNIKRNIMELLKPTVKRFRY